MAIRLRYPEIAPGGFAALTAFGHYINTETALEPVLVALVNLRASQINGCHFCMASHSAELRKYHEPQTRIDAVATWQSSDAFTARERAAFAWTETLTNLPGGSHASEEDYAAVNEFFQGKDLVDLTYAIAAINAWNRLGVAFRPHFDQKHSDTPAASGDGAQEQDAVGDDGGKVAED
jgi:AhpD family alkylhydroperoxidase